MATTGVEDAVPQVSIVTVAVTVTVWVAAEQVSAPQPLAAKDISMHFSCPMTGVV